MASLHAGERSFSFEDFLAQENYVDDELTSQEWKKFKYFEDQLESSPLSKEEKESRLTGYAKDSIQILKVKLVAIKVLNERNLLHRDIVENKNYYLELLKKFKESDIPLAEYLFLEEKIAYLDQGALKRKLNWSTGLNIGLIFLVLLLTVLAFRFWRGQRKPHLVELSKQETLVRNLILQGKSNKEIANELFISLSTVKSHITNIYAKLQVSGRRELLQNGTGTST
ncbi:hypothetical protein GTQ34_10435 [Muricauda sp. JGD-17]|uniref:HTH luxR-type domain-containing protein n=1 Tax=Flagellimonas ochracea TaxID=2696472 RepID=A0A964TCH2_9FLAO|nr:helix-turn-helix transcriptional regulator [Allomuricauda ochracea]NAY92337.1 hypothetical protein [Allomuricauda ochracea]